MHRARPSTVVAPVATEVLIKELLKMQRPPFGFNSSRCGVKRVLGSGSEQRLFKVSRPN
jgi:hypothetical protein